MDLIGQGVCQGSFGELLQGVLPGSKKFLINLKIANASRAKVSLLPSTYSNEKEEQFAKSYRSYSKSYKVVRNILVDIGRHDDCYLEMDSDIPIGKGCSSSTADMIAAINGLTSALSLALKPEYIGRMLTEIEPNDGLHYAGTAAYHHTTGELIHRFDYVPPLQILGIDFGGTIDTVEFNRTPFIWTDDEMVHYGKLLESACRFLQDKDVAGLCGIATESTMLWQKVNPKRQLDQVNNLMAETDGLGLVNTHSGTFIGILYPESSDSGELVEVARRAEASIPGISTQIFKTLGCTDAAERQFQTI